MEVGKLSSFNLEKDFTRLYWELTQQSGINGTPGVSQVTRMLHNEEQIVRCRMRDYTPSRAEIKYFNMDGTHAAQFTLMSGGEYINNVVDMCWSNSDDKYIYVVLNAAGYGIHRARSNGTHYNTVIQDFNPSEGTESWGWCSANGNVQIAAGERDYYLKVGGSLYRFPSTTNIIGPITTSNFYNLSTGTSGTLYDGQVPGGYSGVYLPSPNAFYPTTGTDCYNMMYQLEEYYNVPSGIVPSGCLLFTWYDAPIDSLYVRSISTSGNMSYNHDRWALINIPNYNIQKYPIFMNQTDPYALHYIEDTLVSGVVTSGTSCLFRAFNLDGSLAAFINLNSSDIIMPAGIGDTALITASVINCWGEPMEGKSVEFWISSGDGSVIPIDLETDVLGKCRATFYGGSNVGVTQINAVVNEI